jgi:aspartyl-tRNA(Asn)/glutamyl-tRNA(Gln) amidotransferase subunit C
MQVDDALIAKLEKLSMLKVDEEKKESIKKELAEILNFVENLNDIDVSKVAATFTTLKGGTPLREDTPKKDETLSGAILNNAPRSEDNFFIVPKIIE